MIMKDLKKQLGDLKDLFNQYLKEYKQIFDFEPFLNIRDIRWFEELGDGYDFELNQEYCGIYLKNDYLYFSQRNEEENPLLAMYSAIICYLPTDLYNWEKDLFLKEKR